MAFAMILKITRRSSGDNPAIFSASFAASSTGLPRYSPSKALTGQLNNLANCERLYSVGEMTPFSIHETVSSSTVRHSREHMGTTHFFARVYARNVTPLGIAIHRHCAGDLR